MGEVFGAISAYLDECEKVSENPVVRGVLGIMEKEPKYGKELLRGLQEKCPVVSTVLMIKLVRDYFLQECGPIPPSCTSTAICPSTALSIPSSLRRPTHPPTLLLS